MIPQPTSCGTLARPFMAGPLPLGSRSRREPETSSTAKTPRRKQNRNTASSKSLFLSASKINTSQPGQSIGPLLRSAPRGRGGHDLSTRPVGPRVFQVLPSTAAEPHLVQQTAAALLLTVRVRPTPPTNRQDLPTTNPPALRPRGILVGGLKQKGKRRANWSRCVCASTSHHRAGRGSLERACSRNAFHLPLPHGAHDQALCLALPISTAQKQHKISGQIACQHSKQRATTCSRHARSLWSATSRSGQRSSFGGRGGESHARRGCMRVTNPTPSRCGFLTNQGGKDDEEKENQRRLQIVVTKARTTSPLIPSQGASETGV